MKILLEYCRGAVDALTAQYEMTKMIGHNATAGSARERLIFDFLYAHLPQMTTVVSGMIIDSFGEQSKQQDIVLMLKSMPRLPFASGHDLIFQEGTVATFEIKTAINPATLESIADNIESVKRLKSSSKEGARMGDLKWPWGRILSAIVTYGGADLDTIDKKISGLPAGQPDIYLDLSKGILIRNEGFLLKKSEEGAYLKFLDPALGMAHFLTLLSTLTGNLQLREVQWEKYIN